MDRREPSRGNTRSSRRSAPQPAGGPRRAPMVRGGPRQAADSPGCQAWRADRRTCRPVPGRGCPYPRGRFRRSPSAYVSRGGGGARRVRPPGEASVRGWSAAGRRPGRAQAHLGRARTGLPHASSTDGASPVNGSAGPSGGVGRTAGRDMSGVGAAAPTPPSQRDRRRGKVGPFPSAYLLGASVGQRGRSRPPAYCPPCCWHWPPFCVPGV